MMNIFDNINRLDRAKEALRDAIGSKGVPIPPHILIDEYAAYVDEIVQGGGNNPLIPLFQGSKRLDGINRIVIPPTSLNTPLVIEGYATSMGGFDNWQEPINFLICVTDYSEVATDIYEFPPIHDNERCLLSMRTYYHTGNGFECIYFGGNSLSDATIFITGIYKTEVPLSQQLPPYITVTPASFSFGKVSIVPLAFNLKSNTSWKVVNDRSWVTIAPMSGEGYVNGTINVDVNNGPRRTCIVTFESIDKSATATIQIDQELSGNITPPIRPDV